MAGWRREGQRTERVPCASCRHPWDDKFIPVEAGLHTARCLGGRNCRKVVLVPGCGHTMDDKLARHIVDAVVENCRFADNLQAQDGAAGAAGSRSSPAGTIQLGVASRL